MNYFLFGYPKECDECSCLNDSGRSLKVLPFYQEGGPFRLMLIGQDPTIRRRAERVKHVLMLDDENSQLSRWLHRLFEQKNFNSITIYATNVVKCSFSKPPSDFKGGGYKFLKKYAEKCRPYLAMEVKSFKPDLVITLGQPTHQIFREVLDDSTVLDSRMKEAFTGNFKTVSIDKYKFDYSPCLHIQTFRVAETYGQKLFKFKNIINEKFTQK